MTTVSNRVFARDDFGRFLADIDEAAQATVSELLSIGIATSRVAAPVKTGRLRESFMRQMLSSHSGVYANTAPYAKFQDEGVGPNEKPADVSFWWQAQGRFWSPDSTGTQVIQHPGNPASNFMAAGWAAIRAAAPSVTAKHYG